MRLQDTESKVGHYQLYDDDGYIMSYTKEDNGNELIALTAGWLHLSDGWYATVSRRGLCIIEFGTTKRSALRYARRAWKKEWNKTHPLQGRGYPKIVDCSCPHKGFEGHEECV